ncbi:MAG: serpin family protein [Persicimonas sp.]
MIEANETTSRALTLVVLVVALAWSLSSCDRNSERRDLRPGERAEQEHSDEGFGDEDEIGEDFEDEPRDESLDRAINSADDEARRDPSDEKREPSAAGRPYTDIDVKPGDRVGREDSEIAFTEPDADGAQMHLDDVEPVAESINTFAHRFFGHLEEGNTAFSPTSITAAMAMVYAGAGGETARELASVFDFGERAAERAGATMRVLDRRDEKGDDKQLILDIVNDIWLSDAIEVRSSYVEWLEEHFGVTPSELDFSAPAEAANTINEQIDEDTRGMIPSLLTSGDIRQPMIAVLTNTVYLNASWASPFPKDATEEAPFQTPDGEVEVPMMRQEDDIGVTDGDHFGAIELDYYGRKLAALIVVPDEGKMDEVEESFDADVFSDTVDSMATRLVALEMPQFKVRTELALNNALQEMGAGAAFAGPGANFNGIHREFFIDSVLHEAVIEVDEKNTEAAAVTAIQGAAASGMTPDPIEFVVDRPFLYYVYDKESEIILFAARVVDPSE